MGRGGTLRTAESGDILRGRIHSKLKIQGDHMGIAPTEVLFSTPLCGAFANGYLRNIIPNGFFLWLHRLMQLSCINCSLTGWVSWFVVRLRSPWVSDFSWNPEEILEWDILSYDRWFWSFFVKIAQIGLIDLWQSIIYKKYTELISNWRERLWMVKFARNFTIWKAASGRRKKSPLLFMKMNGWKCYAIMPL